MVIGAKNNDILKIGEDTSKKATINQDEVAKLQYLLTKGLYSDPTAAVIVEWTNNAIDAVVQAGKNPIETPVVVRITKDKFSVEDKGIGLSKDDFTNICMSYLTSTKSNSNDYIGSFGIGLKSFMSLERAATFVCRKDGIECKFIAYQGTEFMEYDLVYEKDTTEENGVLCEIAIQNWREFDEFRNKAIQKLSYYDTVALFISDNLEENSIIRSDDWQFTNQNNNIFIHLCLKDVYYPIDYSKIGISAINLPIALRFGLSDGLTPTPSRESLIYNEATKQLILNKIKKVADWFVDKYNSEWKVYDNVIDAWDKIKDNNTNVKIADKIFTINELLKYSSKKPKELEVQGINVETPLFYRNQYQQILDEYTTLVDYNEWGDRRIKHVADNHGVSKIQNEYKLIIIESSPSGRISKFLNEKYGKRKKLYIKKTYTRVLGKRKVEDWRNSEDRDYRYLLDLAMKPKVEWRARIKEWQFVENQWKSKLIDESKVEESDEYAIWLESYKEELKANKEAGIYKSNFKRLNKQQGEVTLAICKPTSFKNKYKFEKTTFPIKDLHKNNKLTIYFDAQEKEKAISLYRLVKSKWDVALVGKNEAKKIVDVHNYLTFKQFMDSKVFKKVMSSLLFEQEIAKYDAIFDKEGAEIIQKCVSSFSEDVKKLKEYVDLNGRYVNDNELLDSMIATAKEYNLYDLSLWDVYLRTKANLKKYGFIRLIAEPDRNIDSGEIKSLINQILYHKKTFKKQFNDEFEINLTPKEELVTV